MTRKDEAGPEGAARFLARPLIVAVAVAIAIAIYISFIEGEPRTEVAPEDLDARPTGAGSLPDGVADERIEGLRNETATEDFIQDSSATDLRPNILDAGEGPPPATSIEELDIPDHIDPSVVEPGPPGAQPADR